MERKRRRNREKEEKSHTDGALKSSEVKRKRTTRKKRSDLGGLNVERDHSPQEEEESCDVDGVKDRSDEEEKKDKWDLMIELLIDFKKGGGDEVKGQEEVSEANFEGGEDDEGGVAVEEAKKETGRTELRRSRQCGRKRYVSELEPEPLVDYRVLMQGSASKASKNEEKERKEMQKKELQIKMQDIKEGKKGDIDHVDDMENDLSLQESVDLEGKKRKPEDDEDVPAEGSINISFEEDEKLEEIQSDLDVVTGQNGSSAAEANDEIEDTGYLVDGASNLDRKEKKGCDKGKGLEVSKTNFGGSEDEGVVVQKANEETATELRLRGRCEGKNHLFEAPIGLQRLYGKVSANKAAEGLKERGKEKKKMNLLPGPGGSSLCHQCQRNDRGVVIHCISCPSKRFYLPCIRK